MDQNYTITPEAWEKLFAVLPKSKVSNLRCGRLQFRNIGVST